MCGAYSLCYLYHPNSRHLPEKAWDSGVVGLALGMLAEGILAVESFGEGDPDKENLDEDLGKENLAVENPGEDGLGEDLAVDVFQEDLGEEILGKEDLAVEIFEEGDLDEGNPGAEILAEGNVDESDLVGVYLAELSLAAIAEKTHSEGTQTEGKLADAVVWLFVPAVGSLGLAVGSAAEEALRIADPAGGNLESEVETVAWAAGKLEVLRAAGSVVSALEDTGPGVEVPHVAYHLEKPSRKDVMIELE